VSSAKSVSTAHLLSQLSPWVAGIPQWYSADIRLEDRRFESRQGLGIFLFTAISRPALRSTQPPIQWVQGALSLEVKRSGREADHLPPSSAEDKNACRHYPLDRTHCGPQSRTGCSGEEKNS
jgi:hypothetical protein